MLLVVSGGAPCSYLKSYYNVQTLIIIVTHKHPKQETIRGCRAHKLQVESANTASWCTAHVTVTNWLDPFSPIIMTPIKICPPILTQTLWEFLYALYSTIWTHYSFFFSQVQVCSKEIWAVVTLQLEVQVADRLRIGQPEMPVRSMCGSW